MMIGSSRVRASPRRPRAKASPDSPGSIQSSSSRSGSACLICVSALSASATVRTAKPASSRLTRSNSWIAGSSSTTRIEGIMSVSLRYLGADLLRCCVPHVDPLDDVHDVLSDVLRVVTDALDRLGDEHDLQRRRDRARILHHVADQLPHDGEKRRIDRVVIAHYVRGCVNVKPSESVERELEVVLGQLGRTSDIEQPHAGKALRALHLLSLVGYL